MPRDTKKPHARNGFTLIELLVVFTIIALLITIAAPKYFKSLDRSKESVLRYDLSVMRDSIDKFFGDTGAYPDSLQDLVDKKYLRNIPKDPITQSIETWIIITPTDGAQGAVFDIKSGAPGQAADGTNYGDW